MPLAAVSFDIEIDNFAVVTHRVAAERVRRHLPQQYDLETFYDNGSEYAFVSATCFCNRDFRWAAIGHPRHTFNETTYRTYVTYKGDKGVYFFGRYLGTRAATIGQRITSRDAWHADFEIDVEADADGFDAYVCKVSSEAGETSFALQARDAPAAKGPFATGEEHAQFLTYRLHGYFTSSLGFQAEGLVDHPRTQPFEGTLRSAYLGLWDKLGFLSPEEMGEPFSVLAIPRVPFRLRWPVPLP
ncbi:MAG TPA: DUF2071 domain-containing protein [Actinomycetota bacterium]|nr:DUF2071 domain-containing protein [Actinomycetota bacterium]